MAILYGMKAISPLAAANRPHIFGFQTPRTGSDPLLEVWNDDDGTDKVFRVLPDGATVKGAMTVDGLLAADMLVGASHDLVGASHTASGLTIGHVLRATAADTFAFAALIAADIPDLDASKTTSGEFHVDRIPALPASKVTSGTLHIDQIPTLNQSKIPPLSAAYVAEGTLDLARLPNLPASQTTYGVFNEAQIPVITQDIEFKTTNYTLVLADAEKCVDVNSADARTITVPPNSSAAFPVGTRIDLGRTGVGTVEIVAGAGVTIQTGPGRFLRAQHSTAFLQKRSTDTWRLAGDLSAS